ncbi:MAG: 7-cyano-7-deazaguanine synthase [Propionibacteriaceae bacterium]|nr:7-cyano-7-deazaguanine synthase [Propionibacteriaceae bacterium]
MSFLASGAIGAIGLGQDRLIVAENGPGAINLSSSFRLGAPQLNRSMHPSTLKSVSDLFSLALGRPFRIENVALGLTKRQMVSQLRDAGFHGLIPLTVSCDGFPYSNGDHCGRCSSCLFRALALVDDPELFGRIGRSNGSRTRRLADMSRRASFAAR